MSTEELLRAGIAAAKANDSVGASNLLGQVVRADPNSELGWLWLGYCRDVPQQREFCFRKALSINPENVEAKRQIEILNHPVVSFRDSNPTTPLSNSSHISNTPVVETTETAPPVDRINTAPPQTKKTNSKKARRNDNKTLLWVGIGVIILFCIAVVGLVLFVRIMNLGNLAQASSTAPSLAATSIVTPIPNFTPSFETNPCEAVTPLQVRGLVADLYMVPRIETAI
jgi:hypothetical protein